MLCGYAMLCYATLCNAMQCYAMLCYAMLCYAMLCYAMLCYAMLCYAVPARLLQAAPAHHKHRRVHTGEFSPANIKDAFPNVHTGFKHARRWFGHLHHRALHHRTLKAQLMAEQANTAPPNHPCKPPAPHRLGSRERIQHTIPSYHA